MKNSHARTLRNFPGARGDDAPASVKRRGRALLVLLASLALVFGALWHTLAVAGGSLSAGGEVAASQEEPEEVTVTLRPDGFDPAEVVRTAGRFMLSVDNRSGVDEIELLLKRGDGNKVLEIKVMKGVVDWGEEIDLPPGRYTLTVTDHPGWKCDFLMNEKQ